MTSINLSLTPTEVQQVKEVFAKDGQTLEEGLESLIHLVLKTDNLRQLPKKVKHGREPVRMINNGDGTFSYPTEMPDYIKELEELG